VETLGRPMSIRTPQEVLEDHLAQVVEGTVERDLARNHAEDVRLLTAEAVLCGHDGVRQCERALRDRVPEVRFAIVTKRLDGECAFIEWTAEGRGVRVLDGVETFIIQDGLIRTRTVHYTVQLVRGAER